MPTPPTAARTAAAASASKPNTPKRASAATKSWGNAAAGPLLHPRDKANALAFASSSTPCKASNHTAGTLCCHKRKRHKRKRKCKLKRNCFACGEPNLLHGRQPDHTQSRANQKYTLSCCGRLVCTECLASFGKRVSACAATHDTPRRTPLRDAYSDGMNAWLDFCRSRDYTLSSRRTFANVPPTEFPPRCRVVQKLQPKYSSLRCPFCVRKHQASPAAPGTRVPLPPLPNKLGDGVVTIEYRQLRSDGKSQRVSAKVRIVELEQVATTTPAQKGQYPTYAVVSDHRRFLGCDRSDVEWTLVWSKHRSGDKGGIPTGDDQMLSLMHRGGLAAIVDGKVDDDVEHAEGFAKRVWEHVCSVVPSKYTNHRTSGAGGPLHFASVRAVVAEQVHRAEPWFVQTSASSAHAVYISSVNKRRTACATITGGILRGGRIFPSISGRAGADPVYLRFLDAFSLARVNSSRLVKSVNRVLGLRIAAAAIDAVEMQWQEGMQTAQNAIEESPSLGVSAVVHNTRFRKRVQKARTRADKRKLEVLYGDRARHMPEPRGRPSDAAKQAAVSYLSTLNELTMLADPVGSHQDTFNGGMRTGYESKAVFAFRPAAAQQIPLGRPAVPRRVFSKEVRGGVMYFSEFGFCTKCRPNIDLEYHVCGMTYHSVSEPKAWEQGRGGGTRDQFCFALHM